MLTDKSLGNQANAVLQPDCYKVRESTSTASVNTQNEQKDHELCLQQLLSKPTQKALVLVVDSNRVRVRYLNVSRGR